MRACQNPVRFLGHDVIGFTTENPSSTHASAADPGGAPRLSVREKSLYAAGDLADGITNVSLGTFLLFYLTAVCGLPGSLAGAAVAISLMVDAVVDPLIGYISDNTRSRWGRRHPYMFASAIPFAGALGMIYSIPAFESTWALFAYVVAVLIVLRVSFSTFVLPYAAVGAELSKDYTERSVILTYRNFFNICANVSCVVLGFGVFMSGADGLTTRAAYSPFGWVCAGIVLVSVLVSARSTLALRHRLQAPAANARSAVARFAGEIIDVFRNRSFRVLFLTVLVFWVAQGTAGSLSVHAFRYFWELPSSVIQNILILGTVGLMCGIPVCAALLGRFEKRDISAGGLALICLCLFLPPTLRVAGLMPEIGFALYATLAMFQVAIGCSATCVSITFGSMMIDAADEHDLLFGVRREALYFAGLVFSGKCAVGIGSMIAGVALDLIGFPKDLGVNPGQVIPPDTLRSLGLIFGPGTSCISALSVAMLLRYRLDRRALVRIQRELTQRNAH